MLDQKPGDGALQKLLGAEQYKLWCTVRERIDSLYEMDTAWNEGGRNWTYEFKYRRGGKTLCAFYFKEHRFGLMVIFGKSERETFERDQDTYAPAVRAVYDGAKTYHDGKWMMFEPDDASWLDDLEKLLRIKRRPNRG